MLIVAVLTAMILISKTNDRRNSKMELHPYEVEHLARLRRYAPECMVLLKSNGDFPLNAPGKIALYGSGARRTVKGGTGSGDVISSRVNTIVEQGLKNAGFELVTNKWLDDYDEVWKAGRRAFTDGIKAKAKATGVPALVLGLGAVMPEPEYDLPLNGDADTAIYVLARVSGEGSDRNPVKGDIILTDTEVRDILALNKQYKRFMLVLNVGGMVDLTPVKEVGNILILSQLGSVTGDAFADVLLGKSYPSGKLTDTWTSWQDFPTLGDFGDKDDTHYKEGIYVGYRYFDTVGKDVLFPFGYGLGYTGFSVEDPHVELQRSVITVSARILNTGRHPGKEVPQVYVSVPKDRLDQPFQVLAAFAKTRELGPGQSEQVKMSFDLTDLASFDAEKSASVLEAGNYVIRLGTSSRDTAECAIVTLHETVIVEKLSNAGGDPGFTDWKPQELIDKDSAKGLPVLDVDPAALRRISPAIQDRDKCKERVMSLSDSQLASLCCGNYQDGENTQSVIGTAGMHVPGSSGETCDRVKGIQCVVMADGPAGLRLTPQYEVDEKGIYEIGSSVPPDVLDLVDEGILKMLGIKPGEASKREERSGKIYDQYTTAVPVGSALAQSWSELVCQNCGDIVGEEMERFGVHLWLAPALNIHRTPLCGRNYEYFSEDPLISGKMAAAITRGVQAHPGRGVTIKHFCCNNQETNRYRSNSAVSQRALRDLYLKGFEICVKEASPVAVMTSYNLLNGVHTSEREDILEGVLRGAWGFDGIVMSDWIAKFSEDNRKYPYASTSRSVKAGNDIVMPGGQSDHDDIMAALESGALTREQLVRSAARVAALADRLTQVARLPERE